MPCLQVPPPHDVPQAPQFSGSLARFASQPSAGSRLQSACPAVQVKPHAPATHVGAPFGGAGHGVQEVPHVAGSVEDTHFTSHA
jgi:hypothetical protein